VVEEERGITMHTGTLGEFRRYACFPCHKKFLKWFLHFEPVMSFRAVPCPTCESPAFIVLKTEDDEKEAQCA
jgi:DNA-directed RNA polymerase subunit RPC12/RpoP